MPWKICILERFGNILDDHHHQENAYLQRKLFWCTPMELTFRNDVGPIRNVTVAEGTWNYNEIEGGTFQSNSHFGMIRQRCTESSSPSEMEWQLKKFIHSNWTCTLEWSGSIGIRHYHKANARRGENPTCNLEQFHNSFECRWKKKIFTYCNLHSRMILQPSRMSLLPKEHRMIMKKKWWAPIEIAF